MKLLQIALRNTAVRPQQVLNRLSTIPGWFALEISTLSEQINSRHSGELFGNITLLCGDQFTVDLINVALMLAHRRLQLVSVKQHELPEFDIVRQPIFVLGPPLAGARILLTALRQTGNTWLPGYGVPGVMEQICGIRPGMGADSDYLDPRHLTAKQRRLLSGALIAGCRDNAGNLYAECDTRPTNIRLLQAGARNCFRVALLDALFPDSLFVFVYRDPIANVSSIIDCWQDGRTSRRVAMGRAWSSVLPPGWEQFVHTPVEDIAAFQWADSTTAALNSLDAIPKRRWCVVKYERLSEDPTAEIHRVCRFLRLTLEANSHWHIDSKALEPRCVRATPIQSSFLQIAHRLETLARENI
jgi:hypothetical protein